MTEKQLKKVVELMRSGHKIIMHSDHHVEEFALVWQNEKEWMIENKAKKLIDVNFHNLSFYKEVKVDV